MSLKYSVRKYHKENKQVLTEYLLVLCVVGKEEIIHSNEAPDEDGHEWSWYPRDVG
jgi:hypothetical protein